MSGYKNTMRALMETNCYVCRKTFQVQPARIKHGRGKTCSKDCGRKLVGTKLSLKVTVMCKGCGNTFSKSPSHVTGDRGTGQYCSTQCAYRNKKRGDQAANWQGGKVQGNDRIRKSPEYRSFVRSILERDKFTCQTCLKVGGHLHGHHIKPFALFPDVRMDPENVQALCLPCHSKVHGRPMHRRRSQ